MSGEAEKLDPATRVGLSMNQAQLTALSSVLKMLQRGGDPREIMRSQAMGEVSAIVGRAAQRSRLTLHVRKETP